MRLVRILAHPARCSPAPRTWRGEAASLIGKTAPASSCPTALRIPSRWQTTGKSILEWTTTAAVRAALLLAGAMQSLQGDYTAKA